MTHYSQIFSAVSLISWSIYLFSVRNNRVPTSGKDKNQTAAHQEDM